MNRKDFLLSTLGLVGASLLGACDDGGGGGSGGTGGSGGAGAAGGTGGSGGGSGGSGATGGGTSSTSDTGSTSSTSDTGSTSSSSTTEPTDCSNGTNVTIGANHGHELVVSAADVEAGADKTYDITGTSLHAHMVTLTAAHFATLASSGQVMVTSTTGSAHTHSVTVVCA
jgi:hypothetical protein